jgi:hypothetical protein
MCTLGTGNLDDGDFHLFDASAGMPAHFFCDAVLFSFES